MKKFFAGVIKFLTVMAVLGAMLYAVVLYWDKIVDFFDRVKALCAEKKRCCCSSEKDDYADWDE